MKFWKNTRCFFFKICLEVLSKHESRKIKYIRGNNKLFMTREQSKAFMQRSRMPNNILSNPSEEHKLYYRNQIVFCVSLLRKTKRQYISNLNEKDVTDNKTFWQTVKPLLSNNVKLRENITLMGNGKIRSDDDKLAKTLMNFFSNIVKNLNISDYKVDDTFHKILEIILL